MVGLFFLKQDDALLEAADLLVVTIEQECHRARLRYAFDGEPVVGPVVAILWDHRYY